MRTLTILKDMNMVIYNTNKIMNVDSVDKLKNDLTEKFGPAFKIVVVSECEYINYIESTQTTSASSSCCR